jgi:hypothetical protein
MCLFEFIMLQLVNISVCQKCEQMMQEPRHFCEIYLVRQEVPSKTWGELLIGMLIAVNFFRPIRSKIKEAGTLPATRASIAVSGAVNMTNSNQENCVSSDVEMSRKWTWLQARLGGLSESGFHRWLEVDLAELEAQKADWVTERSLKRSLRQELLEGRT